MAKMNFGGVEETVVTREEFTLEMARKALSGRTIACIGYGVQGPGQSLNLKDNGFKVIGTASRQDLRQGCPRRMGTRRDPLRHRRSRGKG